MTPDEAADLAARTLAAIDRWAATDPAVPADHRERVASDLAGLLWHRDICDVCLSPLSKTRPCEDRARDEASLRRTAALYGVTP